MHKLRYYLASGDYACGVLHFGQLLDDTLRHISKCQEDVGKVLRQVHVRTLLFLMQVKIDSLVVLDMVTDEGVVREYKPSGVLNNFYQD